MYLQERRSHVENNSGVKSEQDDGDLDVSEDSTNGNTGCLSRPQDTGKDNANIPVSAKSLFLAIVPRSLFLSSQGSLAYFFSGCA